MVLLEFQGVSFQYPEKEKQVLRDVSFQIERGEFVLLCGASGCGKTTLLRHVLKSQIPVGRGEGELLFDGQAIERMPDEEAVSKIAYVGQDPEASVITDTVWQELAFALESLGLPVNEIRRRTAEMAEYFGLSKLFRTHTSALSGGQKQLLNLASAMIIQPELLVLDEPTSQLDPLGAERFLDTLWKLHEEFGVTVLLSEQRLEGVLPLADRVLVMEEGQLETSTARACGVHLREIKSAVYPALPVANRVAMEWGEITEDRTCGAAGGHTDTMGSERGQFPVDFPLTVREGQLWLRETLRGEKNCMDGGTCDGAEGQPCQHEDALAGHRAVCMEKLKTKSVSCLQAKHVRFSYGSEPVLRDFNWSLPSGSIYGILGGNGSGKSTALKLLAGIYKPQGGKVRTEASVIYLPQNPKAVFSDITAEEELAQFLLDRGVGESVILEKVEAMLDFMELAICRKQHPYDLSGGQAQRLAIAKALLTEPEILLLDEPTKGLDAQFKKKLGKHLQDLVQRGITVVLVSHDLEFCAEYTSHCGLLFDGELICQGETREFFRDNYFYLPTAAKMAAGVWDDVLLGEEIVERLEKRKV